MKKVLAILLALSVLALSACAAKQANSDTQKDSNTAETEQQPDSAQTAETHIVLTEGIVPYLTKILIQRKNKPEIADGMSRIPVTVCCQILFPILFHTAIL